jgi:hypothetical protein
MRSLNRYPTDYAGLEDSPRGVRVCWGGGETPSGAKQIILLSC